MRFPLLLDIYGSILSEKKKELLEYYYNEDYSLSEISELTGISRQGVRDSVKKSEEEINSLEEKLGIAAKKRMLTTELDQLESELTSGNVDAPTLLAHVDRLRAIIAVGDGSQE